MREFQEKPLKPLYLSLECLLQQIFSDYESEQPEKDSCISIAYRNKNGMPVIQCINSMEIEKYPETQYWRYEEILKENMQIDFEGLQERSLAYEKVE